MPNGAAIIFLGGLLVVMLFYLWETAREARREGNQKTELFSYAIIIGGLAAGIVMGVFLLAPFFQHVFSEEWLAKGDNAYVTYFISLLAGPIIGCLCSFWLLVRKRKKG